MISVNNTWISLFSTFLFIFLPRKYNLHSSLLGVSLTLTFCITLVLSFHIQAYTLHRDKTKGRFVCHILRIYIYLIESPSAVKRISLVSYPESVIQGVNSMLVTSIHIVMTTFPWACPSSRYRKASAVSLKG